MPMQGPLRVCPANPRFFCDDRGRAVFLTGSHTWATLHERMAPETPPFDYAAWLDFLAERGHNFFRLWAWEHASGMQFTDRDIVYEPHRYPRTGPGIARDGKPKFDVMRFDDAFFRRLRARVTAAGERDIYVAVMFFQGFSLDKRSEKSHPRGRNAFDTHPFHPENNIHGINGDPDQSGAGHAVHSLLVPEITRLQERFIEKTVDAVGDLDNVLWEITNESHLASVEWQYHLIRFLNDLQAARGGARQPIGMSGSPIKNPALEASSADWISPYSDLADPVPGDGVRPLILDTDHIAPFGHDPSWPWRCLTRGLHLTVMDPYCDARFDSPGEPVGDWEPLRRQMGLARQWSERVDLTPMQPHGEIASSGFCLASPGREYLIFAPHGSERLSVDLTDARGRLDVTWLDCETQEEKPVGGIEGGSERTFSLAGFSGDAVLHLTK